MSLQELQHLLSHPLFWLLAVAGAFLLLLFVTAVMERRYTYPYLPVRLAGEVADVPEGTLRVLPYSDLTPDASALPEYVRIMSDDALAAGFEFDRLVAHAKAPKISILATVWMSADRRTLLLAGAGTVIGMPARQTWLFSPLRDGRVLVTTDSFDEGDHSGVYLVRRVVNVRLAKLMEAHRRRLDTFGAQVGDFREETALEALLAVYRRRTERLVELGRARYADADRLYWHYTAAGGWRICVGFFKQLIVALPQALRVKMRPIGSHLVQGLGETVYARYRRG